MMINRRIEFKVWRAPAAPGTDAQQRGGGGGGGEEYRYHTEKSNQIE